MVLVECFIPKLALRMEAEQGVTVDQDVGLIKSCCAPAWPGTLGIKETKLKIAITISPFQIRLATYLSGSRYLFLLASVKVFFPRVLAWSPERDMK